MEIFLYAHELASMPHYRLTLPTATTIGKVWRSGAELHSGRWVVGMYAEHEDPERRRILWFDVVLRHGPAPRNYRAPDWSNFAAWKAARAAERAHG